MTIAEKLIKEGMEKGMEKGKLEEKRAMAKKLIAKGIDLLVITEITELAEEEIKKLMI